MHGISAHACFDDINLDIKVIVGQQRQKFSVELSRQRSKQQAFNLIAATVGHFENVNMA